jgi:hypothetical protein
MLLADVERIASLYAILSGFHLFKENICPAAMIQSGRPMVKKFKV